MIADVNQYVQSQNKLPLGFINPLLYEIQTGMLYTAYHDIQIGTNGKYPAGPGWDAVTGLGSPDLYNLAQDAANLDTSSLPTLTGIAAVSATDVWAVGDYTNSNYYDDTLTENWNGSTWNVVPSPNPGQDGDELLSVAAVSATDVWAVGNYANGGPEYTLIEHWNGSAWKVVPSPNPNSVINELLSVAAVSATDVWAVGVYRTSNGTNTLIEHWNGSAWNVVPSPNPPTIDAPGKH